MLHNTLLSNVGQEEPLLLYFGLPGQVALDFVDLPEPLLDHLGALLALVAGPHNLRHSYWLQNFIESCTKLIN